jgi:serine/threonine protein kinase
MLIPGTIFNGRYRIDRFIAQGGGGAVYEAYDMKSRFRVALKMSVHTGQFFDSAFRREAQRLAALHHPAFPEVYEWFGVKDNSFFVMEFIPGLNLQEELCDRSAPFPPETVLGWAYVLLDALDFLHTRDSVHPIIHRDIKPANLKLNKTNLARSARIILLDFGLSKGAAHGISERGAVVSIVGYTRGYASPEQQLKDVDAVGALNAYPERLRLFSTRRTDASSDLYSLGATLYTLLTMIVPPDAVKRACHIWGGAGDPLLPAHEINPRVPPLFSRVISRAMSFDPEARYASAVEMCAALRGEQDRGWRQPSASLPTPPSESPTGETTVIVRSGKSGGVQAATLVATRYGLLGECDSAVRSIAFSPDGTHLASGGNDAAVRLWDVATGEMNVLGRSEPGESGLAYVSCVAFAPDGTVASASSDRVIRLWSALPGGAVHILSVCRYAPRSLAFSPCRKDLAAGGSDGTVSLWAAEPGEWTVLGNCAGAVWSVAFTPDGERVAAESDDGTIRVWSLDGSPVTALQTFDDDVRSVAVSPDGSMIAVGGRSHRLSVAAVGESRFRELAACGEAVRSLAFSPDGSKIALGGEAGRVLLFDLRAGRMQTLGECGDVVSSVAFSPDGRAVASGSWDRSIRLWDPEGGT